MGQIVFFLRHTFVKHTQTNAFQEERENVRKDKNKIVIQINLAKSF